MKKFSPGVLVCVLLLGGCGFSLRDEGLDLAALRVSAAQTYGPLIAEVQQQLEFRGVTVNPAEGAPYQLHLVSERSTRRPVTSTRQMNVAEYELRLEVVFTLRGTGESVLIEPASLVAERVYGVDRNNVFGSSQEEVLIVEEMRAAMAEQLIRRISLYLQANPVAPLN